MNNLVVRLRTGRPRLPQAQGGVILVVLLLVLSAGSAVLLPVLHSAASTSQSAAYAWHTLRDARHQLLAYAADYPALYGPSGSGPGHLPCPDTDSRPLYSLPEDWRLAGPNPPCAHGEVLWGRLPAHIPIGARRYRLHESVRAGLWYAVSPSFINNPTDRVVNAGTQGTLSIDGVGGFAVVLIQPPKGQLPVIANGDADTRFSTRGADRVLGIRASSLVQAATRRVELWLDQRLSALWSIAGASPMATLDVRTCQNALVALADPFRPGATDGRPDTQSLLIESTPVWRHWFVRNGWDERVQVACDTACVHTADGESTSVADVSVEAGAEARKNANVTVKSDVSGADLVGATAASQSRCIWKVVRQEDPVGWQVRWAPR